MNKKYRIIALEELRFASSVLRETLSNEIKGISAKYLKIHHSGGIVHVLNAINKAEKCFGIHYMQFAELYEHQEQRDSLIHALGADDFDEAMRTVRHLVERDKAKKPRKREFECQDGSSIKLYVCGHCDELMADGDFCNLCGGRIDWE